MASIRASFVGVSTALPVLLMGHCHPVRCARSIAVGCILGLIVRFVVRFVVRIQLHRVCLPLIARLDDPYPVAYQVFPGER